MTLVQPPSLPSLPPSLSNRLLTYSSSGYYHVHSSARLYHRIFVIDPESKLAGTQIIYCN